MPWLLCLLILTIASYGVAIFSDTRHSWWCAGVMSGLLWAGIGISRGLP